MIKGLPYCGPEVDMWSLGVILFALLSGRLPFDAPVIGDLYEQIGKGKYVVPSHFSSGKKEVSKKKLRNIVSNDHPFHDACYQRCRLLLPEC